MKQKNKNKEKFKEELIELMWKYDLSVDVFLKEVNSIIFWVGKISNKNLKHFKKKLE